MKPKILTLVMKLEELFLLLSTMNREEVQNTVKVIDSIWDDIKKGIL